MTFEYRVMPLPEQGIDILDEIKWLNRMGSRGWELVSILQGQNKYINVSKDSDRKFTLAEFSNALSETKCKNYYFKRRKEIGDKLRATQQKKEVPNNDDNQRPS